MPNRETQQSAIDALAAKQGTPDSVSPANLSAEQLQVMLDTTAMLDEVVAAGRGSIGVDAVAAMSDINSTPQVLTGFDTNIINDTRGVTQVLANDGVVLDVNGVWEVAVKVTLSFAEVNAGRQIKLQLYNATDDVGGISFVYFVGRNQGGVNMSFTIPFEVPASVVGDLLQLRVFSDVDTFTSVDNIGTIFTFIHVSEFQA